MRFFSGFGLKEEKELFDDILYNSDFLVAGFSKGAIDAFEHVKRSKERVDRLILISPAFFQTKDEKFKRVQLMSYKKNPKKYLDSFYKNITYPADFDIIKYKKEDSFDELKRLLYYTWDKDSLESLKKRGVVLEVLRPLFGIGFNFYVRGFVVECNGLYNGGKIHGKAAQQRHRPCANGDSGIEPNANRVVPVFAAPEIVADAGHIDGPRRAVENLPQSAGGVRVHPHSVGKIVARAQGDDSQPRADLCRSLHQAVDDLVDGSITACGDDQVKAFVGGLACQFNGMCGIYRP